MSTSDLLRRVRQTRSITLGRGTAAAGAGLRATVRRAVGGELDVLVLPDAGEGGARSGCVHGLAPALREGLIVVSGARAADVAAAATCRELRAAALGGTPVGVVAGGEDVLALLREHDAPVPALGATVGELGARAVAAEACFGAAPLIRCLEQGARWVVASAGAGLSLYAAPLLWGLGWELDDHAAVAETTTVGHLLDDGVAACAHHGTGGWSVSGAAPAGAARAAGPDARAVAASLRRAGAAGRIATADVTADLAGARAVAAGRGRVRVASARGSAPADELPVLLAVELGRRHGPRAAVGAAAVVRAGAGSASAGGAGGPRRERRRGAARAEARRPAATVVRTSLPRAAVAARVEVVGA